MLSRFAITFLPRSKRLLMSWLQSSSTVIWVSCRLCIFGSCLCIHSANLLVGAFNLFTFDVIDDIYILIAVLLLWGLFLWIWAFIVCRFFDNSHSDWCEVIPNCSFDLHFSNN